MTARLLSQISSVYWNIIYGLLLLSSSFSFHESGQTVITVVAGPGAWSSSGSVDGILLLASTLVDFYYPTGTIEFLPDFLSALMGSRNAIRQLVLSTRAVTISRSHQLAVPWSLCSSPWFGSNKWYRQEKWLSLLQQWLLLTPLVRLLCSLTNLCF